MPPKDERPPPAPRTLEEQCEELGGYLEAAADSCALAWEGGPGGRVVAVRGAARAVLGEEPEALVGAPAGNLFAGGERAARDLAEACAKGTLCEERALLRGGKPFAAQLLVREGRGGAVALVRDLAAAWEQADAAGRAEDLGRFASVIAHEIRNPLTAVKIALQTLERQGQLGPNDLRRTSIALREVSNMELLLNEVLDFARPPSLSLVPGDPRAPVREAVEGLHEGWQLRGVVFALELPERMAPVQLDPVRVRTAVRILCRQAAVAAEENGGGEIRVRVAELPQGRWELTVEDPGKPLPSEMRENAFLPFSPKHARDAGLGLAVVARVAAEHRGEARFLDSPLGGNLIAVTFAA